MAEAEKTRTAHWLLCLDDDCGAAMIIYPRSFAEHDLPDGKEWIRSPFAIDCPVCHEGMDWCGSEPADQIIRNY